MFKKYCAKKNFLSKVNYNKARNVYFRTLKEKKKAHNSSVFKRHKNDLKQTWKIVNNLLGKKKLDPCSTLKINNQLTSDAATIGNHFNLHFAEVGNKLVNKLPPTSHNFQEYLPVPTLNSLYFNPTFFLEIKRIITDLKSKNSREMDGIPSKVLKCIPDSILLVIAHIFNLSPSNGEFIDAFKVAEVVPVFKKDSTYDVNNYRPISLLLVLSKILEKLVYKRLVSFLNGQGFFHKNQFGFRKNFSTSHATTLLVQNITTSFEKKQSMIGVFLDLSKAFDTIDHKILLQKLMHYGVKGLPLEWFSSYLNDRTQQVVCNNRLSDILKIKCGVPQGSILGPLLFLIYVNDFCRCVTKGKTIMFADDTNLFSSESSYEKVFQVANEELKSIDNWLTANKLSLNINKTNYIVFCTPNSKLPGQHALQLRNREIKKVVSVKFLGVIVHEHLSWKPHMEALLSKIRITCSIVHKIRNHLSQRTLLLLYNSMIKSHLQYCIMTWCNGNKTMVKKLQSLVNKFIRLILKLNYRDSVKTLMQQYSLLTIHQLEELETASFMYKYLHDDLPVTFRNLLDDNQLASSTSRQTRSQSNLFPLFCRIELTKQSLKYRGPLTWNSISVTIRQNKSHNSFKKAIKKNMHGLAYHSSNL